MSITNLALVLLSVFLSTSAQLILKLGANKIGHLESEATKGLSLISYLPIYLNLYVVLGLAIYVISAATWIFVLTKVEISTAYPMISLGFIMTFVFGVYFFDESVSVSKISGTLLIVLGCLLVARAS